MHTRVHAALFLSLFATLAAAAASAQTLYTLHGSFVDEQVGSAGPCGYPNGPYQGSFQTLAPFGCATVGTLPAPPSLLGDVAVDRVGDRIWVTDGPTITGYAVGGGTPLASFGFGAVLPTFGPLTGLGCDGASGILWVTDGVRAAGLLPPTTGCAAFLAVPSWTLPDLFTTYTDVDRDPVSGDLYFSSASGIVVVQPPGGGPFESFAPAVTGALPPHYGIAIDHSAGAGTSTLLLTDGALIERVAPGGAPPTFYWPQPVTPVVFGATCGLAYSAHGITFGTAFPPVGPVHDSRGQSTSPAPGFELGLFGGPAGAPAFFFLANQPNCPSTPLLGGQLWIAPSATQVGQGLVPASGDLLFPAPIPPFLPTPLTLYTQVLVFDAGSASWKVTNGHAFSIARP
ncbi:hypothetical protein [Engelhardtia mirabilis]|uniref:ScyD/ScyE family protein n=1 Tax=Engelhardtia mirabilis TaxID=2528011 RepID=A0A518BP54_9BACT|nr:hypothetical protein Pla133_38390 [Planctomycetes bacterium Pla133]QDV03063.1 hypothetical protein Pla86_38380 [Planctomycetes bacterium Pla86]